jgi:hypothetical protein
LDAENSTDVLTEEVPSQPIFTSVGLHHHIFFALERTEETFGPLAAIFPFESEEDVMMQANASEYGLAGYLLARRKSQTDG